MKILSKLGIGICYLMVCLPDVRRCKIGITGLHVGTDKRAKQVTKALPGILIPVFGCILFGYGVFEKMLHWGLKPLHAPYKKGDGHSEIFYFPAPLYAVAFMCGVWFLEYWAVVLALEFIENLSQGNRG